MKKVGEKYKVINLTKLLNLREKFSSDISNQVSIKLKINNFWDMFDAKAWVLYLFSL